MKKSTKFSDVLHILLHMASSEEPLTSEMLAQSAQTNPVVVRRIMAGLRNQGFVLSQKGHGGGWTLSCDIKKVTLHDVYKAIGSPTMIALGNRSESSQCLVEQAVIIATDDTFKKAEDVLLERFFDTTLADVHDIIRKQEDTGDTNFLLPLPKAF